MLRGGNLSHQIVQPRPAPFRRARFLGLHRSEVVSDYRIPLVFLDDEIALLEKDVKKFTQPQVLERLVNRIITDEIISRTLERLRIIAKGEDIPDKIDNKLSETEKKKKKKTRKKSSQKDADAEETKSAKIENEDE